MKLFLCDSSQNNEKVLQNYWDFCLFFKWYWLKSLKPSHYRSRGGGRKSFYRLIVLQFFPFSQDKAMLRLTNLKDNSCIHPTHSHEVPSLFLPNGYTAEDSVLRLITWTDDLEHVLRTETSWVQILALPLIRKTYPLHGSALSAGKRES